MAAVAPFYEGLERNTVPVVIGYIAYASLPLLVGYGLLPFILVVIFQSYDEIKRSSDEPPSMFDEVGNIVSERKRLRVLRRGFAAAAGIHQGHAHSTAPSPPMKKATASATKTAKEKRMMARLSKAVEVMVIMHGKPGGEGVEKRTRVTTPHGRLVDLIAQNEAFVAQSLALQSHVSAIMVAEVEFLNSMVPNPPQSPAKQVHRALRHTREKLIVLGDVEVPPPVAADEEDVAADEAEHDARERMSVELIQNLRHKILYTQSASSSRDLFDELCGISSAAQAISRRRQQRKEDDAVSIPVPGGVILMPELSLHPSEGNVSLQGEEEILPEYAGDRPMPGYPQASVALALPPPEPLPWQSHSMEAWSSKPAATIPTRWFRPCHCPGQTVRPTPQRPQRSRNRRFHYFSAFIVSAIEPQKLCKCH